MSLLAPLDIDKNYLTGRGARVTTQSHNYRIGYEIATPVRARNDRTEVIDKYEQKDLYC